ncbi:Ger(x)C family spore germination protein [Neobacillus sp. D3-1R]|uniref:Ger(x)C family spore germination protein n=1 Tax=Neobacillus sp. D3-1R TaxID=3445778 RepID=UPI003FA109E2
MKKLFFILLNISLLSLALTGCWDRKEVEQMSYVVAIGLDLPKDIDLEKEQAIDVTFQFSNPKGTASQTQGGEKPGQEEQDFITITAPDFITAKNTANAFVTRQVTFNHTVVMIASEELAKTDMFFHFITSAFKEREIRRETNLLITHGKASDFIEKNKPEMGIQPHKYYQFIIQRSIETGMVPNSTLNRFANITDGDADLFLAIYGSVKDVKQKGPFGEEDRYKAGEVPKKGGNPAQLIGSAVFKEGRMIGTLNGEETRRSLLLDNTSQIKDMFAVYPDPLKEKFKISVRIRKKLETDVKLKLRNGPPKIDVFVPLEIELISVPSNIDYGADIKKQEILKKSIEELKEKEFKELIHKVQEEFKAEPFYWSLEIRPLFSSTKEYEKWDWMNKRFPDADINVKVDVAVIGYGKQIKEREMDEVKD